MAASHRAILALILLFSSSAATIAAAQPAAADGGRTTHLHFYMHEFFNGGPNGTTARVAPPARSGGSLFGFVSVVDDALREGADPASRLVGRAQGLAAGTSLADGSVTTMLDFVFTDGPYKGSTVAAFGVGLPLPGGAAMERPVVGGTGAFRMARGYTLSRTVKTADPNSQLILEYDVYISH
uniref:Dirigent protein n=2 Tax=Oryza TaxID=4527 RepID=A0A0E0BA57_9ORYZ